MGLIYRSQSDYKVLSINSKAILWKNTQTYLPSTYVRLHFVLTIKSSNQFFIGFQSKTVNNNQVAKNKSFKDFRSKIWTTAAKVIDTCIKIE
ncbi:hypothetical protein LH53_09945 [Mesotoga sp. TolDC]|nr:hypothetical protein LH53_09945 [Mesotoga sp. TolDC]